MGRLQYGVKETLGTLRGMNYDCWSHINIHFDASIDNNFMASTQTGGGLLPSAPMSTTRPLQRSLQGLLGCHA